MTETIFDISFNYNGQFYTGWVNPSGKVDKKGNPVSFHIVLNDVSFGYLSFRDCKWTINEQRPEQLVTLVGLEIEKHYTL